MDFFDIIKNSSDKDLEDIVISKINLLEAKSKIYNSSIDFIGYDLEYNPTNYCFNDYNNPTVIDVDVRCMYKGYIRKGLKMVYGLSNYNNGLVCNDGRYYYIDDDSYIIDFCKYIKTKDLYNEYDLFNYVLKFIKTYFGCIQNIDREEMFKMIYKANKLYYNPINEHKLSWFKGMGNGVCSEYSILAQNILSMFDFDMYIIIGKEKTGDEFGESHAFNLMTYKEKETGCYVNTLVDFSNHVSVLNSQYEVVGSFPYITYLDVIDDDLIESLIDDESHIIDYDYDYITFGDRIAQLSYDIKREYYIEGNFVPDIVDGKQLVKSKNKNIN